MLTDFKRVSLPLLLPLHFPPAQKPNQTQLTCFQESHSAILVPIASHSCLLSSCSCHRTTALGAIHDVNVESSASSCVTMSPRALSSLSRACSCRQIFPKHGAIQVFYLQNRNKCNCTKDLDQRTMNWLYKMILKEK